MTCLQHNDKMPHEICPVVDDLQARVLVAIVNNRRDMHIVRYEGWYRLPLKRYRRPLDACYLAFYQTKVFGRSEGWAINYYAPILAYSIEKRRDLFPDEAWHPRADDEYYRIVIGPLQRLPHPVVSLRGRRITFLHTTLERLLNAYDMSELAQR